ncbi:hypothetical protein [Demequina lutea]|uniref:DNA-directed RNA polymerase specialized sigma24 family protein n=1 Tax=Demequina lutea TaxID=431489 RepID=A0A7Y9Z7P6_9MICO|nr:hypothetical protein [Demequina lutea]NYI40279.1 DNA-directed RNA polymerase specialized sigma24 family protein [Demequina lutea]
MLTWLTAWVRLIADNDAAVEVANHAVTRVASRRKRLRGTDLKLAAHHEAAQLLAQGVAAVPYKHAQHSPPKAAIVEVASEAYVPGPARDATLRRKEERDPREQTTVGRLEMALEKLTPYERLACVSYFLDGASTDAVASLLEVSRERAVEILEGAAPTIARAVGDDEIPDFSAATDEVEVLTL